jgi:two-component system, NtrC family, sensor kinase
MKRRSKTGRKSAKARQRKTEALKRGNAPKPMRSSAGGQESEVARFKRERDEALEQLSAASEVLKVISSSPGDLEPVFDAMLENATRICEARFGALWGYADGKFRMLSSRNVPTELVEFGRQPRIWGPDTALGRLARDKRTVHVSDTLVDSESASNDAGRQMSVKFGVRTLLAVPMIKDGELIGAINIYRPEVQSFTDKQVALVTNFAAQAVIAFENTRLLNELRQSLEQQTATADVLRVINSSPGELRPVFEAMLTNAVRICAAKFGTMFLTEGDGFRAVAMENPPPGYANARAHGLNHPDPRTGLGLVAKTKKIVHVANLAATQAYLDRQRHVVESVELGGIRTLLVVPMIRDDELLGAISIYRQEVHPFTDKQIAIVQNFAAQAVIAIENTRLLNELRQRTEDLSESLEQQTATSEVLKIISSSPGELEPVFQAMLENATRICEAQFGTLYRCEGDAFRFAAEIDAPPEYAELLRRRHSPFPPIPGTVLDRAFQTKQVVHVADDAASANPSAPAKLAGARTTLVVPMLRNDALVGAFVIYRTEVRLFTDKQISFVQNFAAQAVIAIENTRLLNELRQSLEQQTATAEVLSVISSSPGALEPVFQSMLENAVRICDAQFGILYRYDGKSFQFAADVGTLGEFAQFLRRRGTFQPPCGTNLDLLLRTRDIVRIADDSVGPAPGAAARIAGARSLVSVPMLKEDVLIGAITIFRQEVRPFTDKQVELVKNFAAQAVIAIENTRLLSELRQRTSDLTESLEQQTATSEVLRVISSSPGELQLVFQAMLANATRICESKFGTMYLREGDAFRTVEIYGAPPAYVEERMREPLFQPGLGTGLARAAKTKQVVHIPDVTDERAYTERDPLRIANVKQGVRAILAVPMLKDNELVGVIAIYRTEVRPFSDKQIELVTNFAAQAVIAIENTRLLNELRESLQQQTATAEVLRVISSSPGDLEPVFEAMLGNAVKVCDASFGVMYRYDDKLFQPVAWTGIPKALVDFLHQRGAFKPPEGTSLDVLLHTKTIVRTTDDLAERNPGAPGRLGGARSTIIVPMFKDDDLIGAIGIYRQEVRPFTDKQVEVVSNFAAQAVIAIENTRLLNELRQRTDDLSKSLEDLRTAQDRLVQTEKLASLGQLTAGIAHEIKNPLNFVNNFSAVSVELIDELREALGGVHLDSKQRAEIAEIADTLQGNLDKVVQHGKRADTIVKNMLLHSRQGSGEHRPVDVNALVEESLSLAYHGARAEKQGFEITLKRSFDPAAGEADLFPQEITRALLNLISNGFYATTKRKAEANGGNYEPTLAAATKDLGNRVEIRIRDNGTGIPSEVKEKLFSPFFTTKPAGEGTGLGLSISHDIIVKQHGGSIEVDTRPGEFTEFRIILPRTGASLIKSG